MKQEKIRISVNPVKVPNKLHFDIQRSTRSAIFRDRTKYSRKRKHKNFED